MSKVYALLVGINDYPAKVGRLQGCVNDVDNVEDYLKDGFDDPAIMILKDHDATYDNVIREFRSHLGQAGKDDIALFQYCGHGARSTSAMELRAFDRDNRDEGLVCIDSRDGDNYDLADKELALLLRELAVKDPHVAMILDCCHSGSGTRNLEDGPRAGIRTTSANLKGRPLETFLEGQFEQMLKRGEPLRIPASRHLLMAACDRSQTAKEDLDTHRGIFTTSMFDVLRKSPEGISYADLFVRSRAAVRQYIRDKRKSPQDPQFEGVGGFNAYTGFLGLAAKRRRPAWSIANVNGTWKAECGAIHGVSADPATPVRFAVHDEDSDLVVGHARALHVGAQTCAVEPDFEADPAKRYMGEITSLPQAPLLVGFSGAEAVRASLTAAIEADVMLNVALVDGDAGDGVSLTDEDGEIVLRNEAGRKISSVLQKGLSDGWAKPLLQMLAQVSTWRRTAALANPKPALDPELVDFRFVEDGADTAFHGPEVTLEYRKTAGEWKNITGKLELANRTQQPLNFLLLYFSDDFGVQILANEQVAAGGEYMTLTVGTDNPSPEVAFSLDDGDEARERIKLVLSTERIDDFQLALDPIKPRGAERGFGSAKELGDAGKPATDDWFVKDMTVRIVRRVNQIGAAPVSLAGGGITIEPHSKVSANLAVGTMPDPARALGDEARLFDRLAGTGLRPATFGGERGAPANMIELSGIANAQALKDEPIRMRFHAALEDGEIMVPLIDDGQHILLAGDSWVDEAGSACLEISEVHESLIDQRSLGSALKMYLFKTYLGKKDVNRLRAAEFREDGTYRYSADNIPARVAAANNILLVVHGIIGDTTAMLGGVQDAALNGRFDLVLSYDYENLSTPIDETAGLLAADLAGAGLTADDGKALTIMAHSMGGLVSRVFIEQLGGAAVVDHLVMCGTPNAGSPFGRVGTARKILQVLATVGTNFAPQFCGPALILLQRSKKLTPTLEQMSPDSEFIERLNTGEQPSTRYSILAGDIDAYDAPAGSGFAKLLVKAGRGPAFDALFSDKRNDIAVGVESIRAEAARPAGHAVRGEVACHHLNYFTAPAGIAALTALDWSL
ncbi:caspase family protein [Pacificimonas sp. WHA3]|uniref:Caspase family protein n=1 Tax=Pacificimonas pallii TaxID=2827236 RepID=A0ABS6SBW6_9SPHN|nr:caspase family protein [Pacificimonas pallii]MBV7255850.1 caspase family protein [Pacificimonas pallii]